MDEEDELEEEDGFSFGAVGVKQPILLLFAPNGITLGGRQDTPVYIMMTMSSLSQCSY